MTTTNMLLDLPTVGVTVDPTWATKLNTALTTVDEHDHTSDKGVQVPTAGININADLSLQSNDLTEIRSLSLNNNVSTLPSGDVRALYASGGNLYYNNNSGTAIQLTTGSSLNTGALALNVWEIHELAGNLTLTGAESYVFIDTDTSSGRTINLPPASSVTGGRYFVIKDKTGDANTNNITVSPNGSDTIDGAASSTTISSSYGSLIIVSDGVSAWLTNGATGGFIQLGGDLLGTGSTVTAPRVGSLTGIASLVTMANNTALNSRNAANSINVNLAKVSGSDVATYGDSQVAGSLTGTALTLTAGTTSLTATSNTTMSLAATTTNSVTAGTALTLTGATTAALSSTAAGLTLTGGTTASLAASGGGLTLSGSTTASLTASSGALTLTGQAGITGTATTSDISLTATAGSVTLAGSSGSATVSGTTTAALTAGSGNVTVSSTSGDVLLTAGDEVTMTGKIIFPGKAVTSSGTYTVDTTTNDYTILVDTSAAAGTVTINLPTGTTGRILKVKDVSGGANTYNIVLVPSASLDASGSNLVMNIPFQGVTLVGYGGDWFTIGNSTKNNFGVISQRLSSAAITTSASAQSTNLTFNVKSGETWFIQLTGGVTTQAGNGGKFGWSVPGSSTLMQAVYAIGATPNYGVDTTGGPQVTIDTDGATWPFKVDATVVAGGDGAVTFQFHAISGGDSQNISAGTFFIARRGVSV